MIVTKILSNIAYILFLLNLTNLCKASVPNKFFGDWEFSIVDQNGFPWHDQIKHPVQIKISEDTVFFVDQSGFKCLPKVMFYDDDLDSLVFKHCLPVKSELAFAPFYRLKRVENRLELDVWTFKLLFKAVGKEQKQKQPKTTKISQLRDIIQLKLLSAANQKASKNNMQDIHKLDNIC